LDLADGELYADYRATNDTPGRVWLGQVRTWEIPPLVADAANELMQDIAPLAQRILDGSDIEVNPRTGDPVGVLNDDAGRRVGDLRDHRELARRSRRQRGGGDQGPRLGTAPVMTTRVTSSV